MLQSFLCVFQKYIERQYYWVTQWQRHNEADRIERQEHWNDRDNHFGINTQVSTWRNKSFRTWNLEWNLEFRLEIRLKARLEHNLGHNLEHKLNHDNHLNK